MRAARHPADSYGRPTAGAQVLARVPMVPWYPYRSGPALYCRVPPRLVLSCLVLSCLVLSCLVLSCLVLSCLVLTLDLT